MRRIYFFLLSAILSMVCTPPIWASGTIAANNSNDASTTTDAQVTNALWQDTNPNEANYLTRRHALVGAHCMVNRYLTTVSVAGGTTGFENLVDKDLSNAVTFADGVKADLGVAPSITVRDVSRTYAKGTTAGFVVSVDGSSLLSLKVIELPMEIFFYKDGKLLGSKACTQKGGSALKLTVANLSSDERIEFTAQSNWDFDEIGFASTGLLKADVAKAMKLYYAFVGKNGKYYLDKEDGIGIDAFKQATGFKGDITLSTWPKKATDLIDADSTNCTLLSTILSVGAELDVCAYSADGLPFKKGMEAGVEYGSGGITVLGGSSIKLYNAQPTSDYAAHPSGYKWTDVNTKSNYSGSLLDVNLGGGRTTKSVIAEGDFNGIGLKTGVGIDLGATVVYRMYVLLPVEMDTTSVLEISADKSICEDTKEVLLNSNKPVTWSCNSTDITLTKVSDTQWKATGFKHATPYVFTATDTTTGEAKTTTVHYGVEKQLDLHIVPWVNNFTDPSTSYKVMSEQDLKDSGLNGFTLIPLDKVKDTANLVNGSVDDYMTYFGGLQLAGSTVIACVQRTPAFTAKQDTRVGFVMKIKGEALNVDLLSHIQVGVYNGSQKVESKSSDNGFRFLEASVAGSDHYATTVYNVMIPAGQTFDKIMLYNNTVLTLNLSNIQVYYAFMEPEADAQAFDNQKVGGEIVSYKNGARIDEKLLNGFNGVAAVASYVNNYTNFIDGNLTDSLSIQNVATVAGDAVFIPVKLGKRYDGGNQVVIYTNNIVGLANVDLAKIVKLTAYLNGKQVDELTNWNALDAKVIGVGGHYTMRWTPQKDFDEIVISSYSVASLLHVYQAFYGIRIVSDVDRDGIPDSEDDESCPNVAFLVDENEPELDKIHDFTNSKMYLHRTFAKDKWTTICLPVDMTYNQFAATFGSDAKLAMPKACREKSPNTLQFDIDKIYGNQVLLQKNMPYIIKVDKISNETIPTDINADNAESGTLLSEKEGNLQNAQSIWSGMTDQGASYLIRGVNYSMDDNKSNFDYQSISHTSSDVWKATSMTWHGTFVTPQAIGQSFYTFRQVPTDTTKDAELTYVTDGVKYFRGLRCWMTTDEATSNSKAKELSIAIGNEIISNGTATGINEVNGQEPNNGNIYTLAGVLVRRAATSTDGLSKGIYIWNNKKIEIK